MVAAIQPEPSRANGHAKHDSTSSKDPDSFWASLQEDANDQDAGPSRSGSTSPVPSSGKARSPRTASRSQSVGVKEASTSTSTPWEQRANGGRGKKEAFRPPLIDQLPVAWDEAHETFEVLEKCVYETKRLGLSREQDEMMICDCSLDKSE